jgi:uncharacterized membrane protein YczE
VNSLLGGILKAMGTKWLMFWLFLSIGIVILGVGVFLMVKARGMAASGGQDAVNASENKKDENQLLESSPTDD